MKNIISKQSLRIVLALLLIQVLLISHDVFAASRVHFISVGMSDAILIESNGHYGLVDASNPDPGHILDVNGHVWDPAGNIPTECGSDCSNSKTNVTAVVNYLHGLGVKQLDFVLGTHNHSDHIGGIPTIAKSGLVNNNTTYYYKDCRKSDEDTSNEVLGSSAYSGWQNYQYCKNAEDSMRNNGAKMYNFDFNSRLDHFNFYGSKIDLYNIYQGPTNHIKHEKKNENSNSIVVKVTDEGGKSTLLTSDILEFEERKLLKIGPVDVLKLSHHGIKDSNATWFLNAMNPKEAVMTNLTDCGGREDCNHTAIDYLKKKGVKVSATSDNGSVVVDSSSGTLMVENLSSVNNVPKDTTLSGWVEKGGNWYYYQNGQPLKGWQELQWSGGKDWFYFNHDGVMLKDTVTPDGYRVNENGVWDKNKQNKQSKHSEESENQVGATYSNWTKIGDSWYYFDNEGKKTVGWQEINNVYYYFEDDGKLKTGWIKRDDKYYYYDSNGNLLRDTTTPDGYKVDKDGVWSQEEPDSTPSAAYTGKDSSGSSSSSSGSSSGASGSSSSSGEKCVKLAIIKIKGKDCIESTGEAIFEILGMILNIFTFGVGIAATGGFIFCGYQYITSKNEPAVIVKVKTRMLNIVIGLIIYFMFWGLIGLLLPGGLW